MKIFDWETFWYEHPRKQLLIKNTKWANLRPVDYDYGRAFEQINSVVNFQKTDRVLEIGCGTGEMLPFLTKLVPARQVAAVDLSETMIEMARVKNQGVTITKAPAHMMQFMDESFDKVFCTGVIQHIPGLFFGPSIREMLRVTKLGGYVFIGDVLEKADPAAEVFVYPRELFEKLGEVKFSESIFEKRLNILIKKTYDSFPTFMIGGNDQWGVLEN